MLEGKLQRKYFTLEGPLIDFFGHKAMSLDTGMFAVHHVGNVYVEFDVDMVRQWYEIALTADDIQGRIDDVAQLLLSPLSAAAFCHIDYLRPEKLWLADEHPDFIDVRDVDIEGRNLLVRILRKAENSIVTADARGRILA